MLIFLDTEFTDFVDCELISLGMISEDGLHSLYLEVQDFDRDKCNDFVRSEVWASLGRFKNSIVRKEEVGEHLRAWFDSAPDNLVIAYDSEHDQRLLATALAGPWPTNVSGWYDLRPLLDNIAFNNAVERYYDAEHPQHHAFFDVQAHLSGWHAWGSDKQI